MFLVKNPCWGALAARPARLGGRLDAQGGGGGDREQHRAGEFRVVSLPLATKPEIAAHSSRADSGQEEAMRNAQKPSQAPLIRLEERDDPSEQLTASNAGDVCQETTISQGGGLGVLLSNLHLQRNALCQELGRQDFQL